jgi:hypothetical protein
MKNKKWLLLLIIAIPSLMWVLLESSTINSYKLPHYGPKALKGSDTMFHKVSANNFMQLASYSAAPNNFNIDSAAYPLYTIMFVKQYYSNDSYRLAGLWEYLNYKKEKIGHIPIFLVTETKDYNPQIQSNLAKFTDNPNVHFLMLNQPQFDSINKNYFKEKPIHIDYSFFVLIDGNRNVRGYYDGRFASEIKRLIDEYKHLRLKDEKQKLIKDNEIKSNS